MTTDNNFDELRSELANATEGSWRGDRYDKTVKYGIDTETEYGNHRVFRFDFDADDCNDDRDFQFVITAHNHLPALLAALDQARAEREERTLVASRAQEALRYVLNGLPATDAVWAAYGNADSARAWLASRDERMKREGAAEWLENAAREGGYYERSSEGMLEEAKQLREGSDE